MFSDTPQNAPAIRQKQQIVDFLQSKIKSVPPPSPYAYWKAFSLPRASLARAVFIHRLGEIRDRTYENQQHRASGLNLVVTAIVLWNTRYLERAVAMLRKSEDVPDPLLSHLSPLGWEHVNLTGDYIWAAEQ